MRKLAAIMFTDIAGYTALMSQDEEQALHLLQKNRALLKPIIEQFRGEWLKEIGDGTLSSFASAVDAVNCALEIQHILRHDPDLSIRIGIHIGDVVFERGDVFGDGVNVASRIEPLAEPGCICVSEQVYDSIRNKPGIETTFLGEQQLKGIDHPIRIFTVTEQRAALREPERAAPLPLLRRKWAVLGVAAAASLAVVVILLLRGGPGTPRGGYAQGPEAALGAKSIVVLPFANYSEEEGDWFSDGITEEIITHLSKIGDLKVISRTSAMQYKGTDKSLRQIGEELGVAAILEGSVRRAGGKLRITGQLIDPRTDAHLWAESYNREEDLTDIFAIQSDVASQIAAALKATLTPEEKDYIEQKPTDNLEAYDYYLQGNNYFYRMWLGYSAEESVDKAVEMYRKAVELDPGFALAWARLCRSHLRIYGYSPVRSDPSQERLARARESLDKALALDPDHPEVLMAHGYYYYYRSFFGPMDFPRAGEYFRQALAKAPNNSEILTTVGIVQRRLGEWEASLPYLEKAYLLDPQHVDRPYNLWISLTALRRWKEAEHYADIMIQLEPNASSSYGRKITIALRSSGDIPKMREVLEQAKNNGVDMRNWENRLNVYEGNYEKALEIYLSGSGHLFLANLYTLMERPREAAAHYDSARIYYEQAVTSDPGSYNVHAVLGQAYAGLGRREEALRQARLATTLKPLEKDAYHGQRVLIGVLQIYVLLGEYDQALDRLELLLSIPGDLSVPWLRIDPTWDPLREHPRFRGLVAG